MVDDPRWTRRRDGVVQRYHHGAGGPENSKPTGMPPAAAKPETLAVAYETRTLPPLVDSGRYPRHLVELRDTPYEAAITPRLREITISLEPTVLAEAEEASAEIARFDEQMRGFPASFAGVLLRTESASSSQIENLTASSEEIAEAQIDELTTGNAPLIVRNVRAMQAAIDLADDLSNETIIEMHRQLLEDSKPAIVGRYRDEQVWIGGRLPQVAAFVPPHHERVAAAMSDLVAYARRSDVPALTQAAITHAQFETIHPFPDGNGRTGRALVQSMLRRAGVIRHVTIPISSGLLTDLDTYFSALGSYRNGDPEPIVSVFANAALLGLSNARQLNTDLSTIRSQWALQLRGLRRDARAHKLADVLLEQPVVNAKYVGERLGLGPQSTANAIEPLVAEGILRQTNPSAQRNRVWVASGIIGALDAFAERSGRRQRL